MRCKRIILLLVVMIVLGAAARAVSAEPTADEVLAAANFSDADKQRILAGEMISGEVKAVSDRDLSLSLAFIVKISPKDLAEEVFAGNLSTSDEQLTAHIDDLLRRFTNRALGDTVFRVGCDLGRKLGPEDRLQAPLRAAIRLGLPYHMILEAIKAAMQFRATDENGETFPADREFFREAQQRTDYILQYICTQKPDLNQSI